MRSPQPIPTNLLHLDLRRGWLLNRKVFNLLDMTRCPSRLLILFERQRRYSEIGERLLEGLPSVAREPISAAYGC